MVKQQTVPPDDFVLGMTKRWTDKFGNVASPALKATWRQIGEIFNATIASHSDLEERGKWKVLQPATGTGKTQGAVVYCALLSRLLQNGIHPGVLIVTRLKVDADLMAEQINDLSRKYGNLNVEEVLALAHHSDSQTDLANLKNYPVVVITHSAYEIALDYLGHDGTIQQTWPLFHEWNGSTRKLVIVDECLDCVEQSEAGLDGLRRTLGLIPQKIRKQFPREIDAVEIIIEVLTKMDQMAKDQPMKELMLLGDMITKGDLPDFTAIRATLRKEVRWDLVSLQKTDPKEKDRLSRIHDQRLKSLHCIFRSWMYYARLEGKHTLNTARLLVPDNTRGPVVLDATASSNPLYEVFDRAVLCRAPTGARNYKNVTLHVSIGHRTGKRYMSHNAKQVCAELISDLCKRIPPDRRVFVVCHKDVEPVLTTYNPPFEMLTGHWGAIAGSNEWRDCDTVVIFGLPYRRDTWAPNVFMACQGPQSNKWLNSLGNRPFNNHKDIRVALRNGQMITDVVQAINRVRCRQVIDEKGNCPVTDIYILLPNDRTYRLHDALLEGIKREMPGVKIVNWDYAGQLQKKAGRPRRSNYELALIIYLENMADGRVSVTEVARTLGMSRRTMANLIAKMDDLGSALSKAMVKAGVRYEVLGKGQRQRAFFVKDSIRVKKTTGRQVLNAINP